MSEIIKISPVAETYPLIVQGSGFANLLGYIAPDLPVAKPKSFKGSHCFIIPLKAIDKNELRARLLEILEYL